jgi:GH25 family lysozyme M1 (1,4-beta-N-acetylmuramidase)
MLEGIDVSAYQSSTFATTGLDFVIIKATEGTHWKNPKLKDQAKWARDHGKRVGWYHFSRPGSAHDQVYYFLDNTPEQAGDFLVNDWEDRGVSNADKDAWIKGVQKIKPHSRVLLYCNTDFWLHRDITNFDGDGLWIADPNSHKGHPAIQHPWTFHQYSFANGQDKDVANFPTRAAFDKWTKK